MQRLSFGPDVALTPSDERLSGVSIAPLTPSVAHGSPFQAAVFRIEAEGAIRRHPATVPQLLAVLDGSGEVSGADGVFESVGPGDAVYVAAGEDHETRSTEGMTVLIIEGPGLVPFGSEPSV